MKHIISFITFTTLLLMALDTSAVPAKRGVRTYRQPDGTTVNVTLQGDENFHYYLTPDGLPLVEDTDGALYFARMEEERLVRMPYLACDADRRPEEVKQLASAKDAEKVVSALRAQAAKVARRGASHEGLGRFETTFPSKGKLKALVLLVEYSDVKFTTENPKQYFSDMLNLDNFSEYGGTGSARQYFLDASNGQFDLTCGVYGPVALPYERAYYGGNGLMGSDENPEDMVVHAINSLKGQVDFSEYDCDKDGIMDNVFVFYAGTGEASGGPASSVWPHAWELSQAGKSFTVDGILVDHYACTCELQGSQPDGIGTFCHEFSHIMGLPDLYNTYSSGVNYTPGEWTIMDYGSYNNNSRTPPTYSAYERNAMGWLDVQEVVEGVSLSLEDIKTSNHAVAIASSKPKEFYLLENRQQSSWDTYLPNHGMLIWHMDYDAGVWKSNIVNNDGDHQYVDLIEANGVGGDASGASWPGTTGKTAYTATTNPAFIDWSGKDLGLPITGIEEKDGKIYFDVDGGDFELQAPAGVKVTEVTPISLHIGWQLVEKAKGYTVSVYSHDGLVEKFVPGFKAAKLKSTENSITVNGLEAETEYTIELSAFTATRNSECVTLKATTPEMSFPYVTPQVLPADEESENAFTARWEPVAQADHYLLHVESAYEVEQETAVCDFGSLIFRVPTGWDYSLKTSRYTDPEWCGKAAPSAKLDKDKANITSPIFEHDIQSCTFWARLRNEGHSACSVEVEGLVGGKWQTLQVFSKLSAQGTTYALDSVPEGTRQLRLTYHQSDGEVLALDDIEIINGGIKRNTLEGYEEANVGNAIFHRVDHLPAGLTGFYYRIRAISVSGEQTLWSAEQFVRGNATNILNPSHEANGSSVIPSSDGSLICISRPGTTVEVYASDGRSILSDKLDDNGHGKFTLSGHGVYIVRLCGRSFKVVI